jgi:hypothetical protein
MKHIAEIAYVGCRTSSAAALVLLAALFVSGCETSSTVSAGPNPVKCIVALNAPPMMDAVGGTGSLNITTQRECAWDASSNVGWISALSPASGQGPAEVSFSVSANEGFSARDGTIEVNGTQARVSQRAVCRYEVSPSSQRVGASGAVGRITVTTAGECAWRAATESEWIELTSSPAGAGSGTVAYVVRLNDGAQRSGSISVAGQQSLITQAANPAPPPPPTPPSPPTPPPAPACTYSISPTEDAVLANDGAGLVNISTASTCRWTAASNVAWMTISSSSSGMGSGWVTYRFEFNLGPPRTGTLTIAGRTFTVRQGTILSSTP